MIVTERHPIDGILADLGSLVRRGRAGSLTAQIYRATTARILADIAATDADPSGLIAGHFEQLEEADGAGTLTTAQFEEAANAIRVELLVQRSKPLPQVPAFAVLPSGIHGQRIGALTVIDGGRLHTNPSHTGA